MYQQAPQQNYQPQYAPQYAGKNFQPYPAAPFQYVSQAPSGMQMVPAQPAMMNGIGRGPDGLYRGQRPPNPCMCCKFCCGGTCSLRTGVIVIGISNIVAAIGQAARVALPNFDDITGKMLHHYDISKLVAHSAGLLYADAAIFWLVSGIIMLAGAVILQPTSCSISGILVILGGVYHLCVNLYIATDVSMGPYFKYVMTETFRTYIEAFVGCLFRFYLGYCVYALGKQIRNGEYSVGMPQPMMRAQPTFTTAPSPANNNALPNPSQMAVAPIADIKNEE